MSESNTKQMIQLNHVKFGYSDTEVLEEINLTIHEGEYVVLTGENGSGKSTLMRLILDEPTTGVDARSTKILYDMLYEINTKYNTTIFMITHGRLQECKGCDRILRMDEGRIVEE